MSTRERLLRAASELFAERGYHAVTVRDISQRAEANVAAVGYHFGDKLRLYRAVIDHAFENVRKLSPDPAEPAADLSPEQRLRSYLNAFLPRMVRPQAPVDWFQRLMRHEISTPSPIAHELAERIFRPRMLYLGNIVAELLDAPLEDARVRHAVFSIQAQCMFYARDNTRSLLFREWSLQTAEEIRAAAEHIADFSIAGIRGLAAKPARRPQRQRKRPVPERRVPAPTSPKRRARPPA